jgi:hypothetical protein
MGIIEINSLKTSEFLEEAFRFWFSDNHHLRSPFPSYIHTQLKEVSTQQFLKWLNAIHLDAKDELNDDIIAEKFEEFLFEAALQMVVTEDEKITILYPFLPRCGDKLKDKDGIENTITDRYIKKEQDNNYLYLKCLNLHSNTNWETSMVLPA